MRDETECCSEFEFDRRQRMNVINRKFTGWHNPEMFTAAPGERDGLYKAVQDVWAEYERSRALATPTLDFFAYMMDKAQSGTKLEGELIQKFTGVWYHMLSLGAFLRCVPYGPIDCLAYPRMVLNCEGGGALLYVPLEKIKWKYVLGIHRLL